MLIDYSPADFKKQLQHFANTIKTVPQGDFLFFPEKLGKGFLYAENFSSGISIMVADLEMSEEINITRQIQPNVQFFILLFNENVQRQTNAAEIEYDSNAYNLANSMTRLVTSLTPGKSILPAGIRAKSLSIMFNKQMLLNFIGVEAAEAFINNYFPVYLKKNYVSPIDAESRSILNEVHREIFEHPLSKVFIENRAMILLEKFLSNFILKMSHTLRSMALRDEEINRLVISESMLLRDYSVHPPTINLLAKTCAMSPTKFKNDFKMLYGLPVFEYFQKNRMAYARSLLQDNTYTIKEVGMMAGYTNLGHFAAAFKKEFGVLPSELQQMNKITRFNVEGETASL